MKTSKLMLGLLFLLAIMPLPRATAQALSPRPNPVTPGPTVSPYINLLRSGGNPALNYYGLVRPQFEAIAGFQAVQQRFGQLSERQGPADLPNDAFVTGHGSSFMNYGSYFMTTNVTANAPPSIRVPTPTTNQPRRR